MLKDEWIKRCAAFFVMRKMSEKMALETAEVCWCNDDPDDGLTPEEAAENELDNWDSDD